jgi:hypothetical protein
MAHMAKRINVVLTHSGEGTLACVGYETFRCVGKSGLSYPHRVFINPNLRGMKQNPHYSNAYSCDDDDAQGRCIMRFSILVWPKYGVFIHEWSPGASISEGGRSHGCIHLDTGNAANVYNWVDIPTWLHINYPWPQREK